MGSAFEFRPRENALALHLGDDFLIAARRALAGGNQLQRPAAQRRIFLIHAEQIASEKRRLVAACAGADFQNGALFVGGVARQQRKSQVLLGFIQFLARGMQFIGGQRPHFRIVAPGQAFQIGDFGGQPAISPDRFGNRLQFRQFAREGRESGGIRARR